MYSIQMGLKAIKSSAYCFVQAIDNPFIEANMLEEIFLHRSDEKFVAPTFKGKSGHPVLINQKIMEYICSLEIKQQHLNEVLKHFPRKHIALDHPEILLNINTQEDYRNLVNGF